MSKIKDRRVWLYHKTKDGKIEGKIFDKQQVKMMLAGGWKDTPDPAVFEEKTKLPDDKKEDKGGKK
jgi:hypothetical protein